MDFDLNDDQRLLKNSVDRLIADRYAFEQRKKYAREPDGWSRELWAQYAELGLLGLPFAEAHGGFGGGPVETMIVMEAFGRGLILEPYLATVTLGGGLVRRAGSAAQQAALLPEIAAGTLKLAFAHVERSSRYNLADVAATAKRDGAGWVLDGEKSVVLHGDCADKILLTARTGGGQRDRDGIGVFLVDANAPGVTRRAYPTQDATRAAEVTFSGAHGEALGDPGGGLPMVERVVDEAIAALCSEAVGVMTVMHETTVEYMKTRKQFGRAIGEFAGAGAAPCCRYVRGLGTSALDGDVCDGNVGRGGRGGIRRRAMSAAKVQIGRSGKLIGQVKAVRQLHGGIAMTMEYKVGHYFKRMTMIDMLFGDADRHLAAVAEAGSVFQ